MSITTDIHPLAAEYLRRLKREARVLPRSTRAELVADIEAHLAEAMTPGMPDAEVLTELVRLGDPAEIVDAQRPERVGPPSGKGTQEWAAIFFLLFGGFLLGIGWLFGLVLLWSSNAWRTRDKWIGTLLIPGGFASLLLLAITEVGTSSGASSCSSSGTSAVVNGHPVRTSHTPHMICTSGSGSRADIWGIVLDVVLLITPILTAIYLARKAGKASTAAA